MFKLDFRELVFHKTLPRIFWPRKRFYRLRKLMMEWKIGFDMEKNRELFWNHNQESVIMLESASKRKGIGNYFGIWIKNQLLFWNRQLFWNPNKESAIVLDPTSKKEESAIFFNRESTVMLESASIRKRISNYFRIKNRLLCWNRQLFWNRN